MRRAALPPEIELVHVKDDAPRLPRYLTVHGAAKRLGLTGSEMLARLDAADVEVLELRGSRGMKPRRLVREDAVIELLRTSRRRTAVEDSQRLDLALDLALEEIGAPTRARRSAHSTVRS